MPKWMARVGLTVLVSLALAFAVALLLVRTANAVPGQTDVPVYVYGS